ncbi:MAG TPA: hypothetical protein VFU31_11750 [Candidatus Binatia bacterium]|nr:hypothetical protein [Candidatus Binatia bacterium]
MGKSFSGKIILLLALVQAIAGLLRGFNWVQLGVDFLSQGLLLLPMIGAVAVMRGLFISAVALLYVLFVIGALLGRSWAWWACLPAAIVNLLLVLSVLAQGAPVAEAIVWSVIPVILLLYLFSQTGRAALKAA